MARIRSIKPEFWEDEDIALLSPMARLLYIATWNMADDEGLLRWGASFIKSRAFPYDDLALDEIEALMVELVEAKFVHPYKGGRSLQPLGWIPSFGKHQKPNRPQPSKLPAPSLQNPVIKEVYAERYEWKCHVCGEHIPHGAEMCGQWEMRGLSMDHVKPRCEGGTDYPSNIKPAHRVCNSSKGGKWSEDVNDSLNDSVNDSDGIEEGLTAVGEGRGVVGTDPSVDKSDSVLTLLDETRAQLRGAS